MSNPAIKEFVFKGILANHAIRDMQSSGILRRSNSSEIEKKQSDLFASIQETVRNGSLEMQYAYRVLFVLENIVREFIDSRLSEEFGSDWFETKATAGMKDNYSKRKATEEKNLWHTGRNKHPVFYIDFGDLSKLITNNWPSFVDLLPNQPWVQSRLEEVERSRNVIAHTNVLAAEEVDRLEMYLRDWIRQIG